MKLPRSCQFLGRNCIQEVERRIEAMDETGKSQAYLKIILCGAVRKVEILAMLKNAEIDLSKYEDYPFV